MNRASAESAASDPKKIENGNSADREICSRLPHVASGDGNKSSTHFP